MWGVLCVVWHVHVCTCVERAQVQISHSKQSLTPSERTLDQCLGLARIIYIFIYSFINLYMYRSRVGQNYMYVVYPYTRYFWQGTQKMDGHMRCIYIRFWPTLPMLLMCVHTHAGAWTP